MGDRAQIGIRGDDDHWVFLYTHWGAPKVCEDVRQALMFAPDRYTDSEYFTRIVFDRMKGDDTNSRVGYGISCLIHDDNDVLVMVDARADLINVYDKEGGADGRWESNMILDDDIKFRLDDCLYLAFAGTSKQFVDKMTS